MNALTEFATRGAVLLLAMTALAVWFVAGDGGPTESAGGLEISISDSPDPVAPGGVVTYTITVNNTGATEETGVIVTDTVTGQAVILSATPTQGSCDPPTPTTVSCFLGTVAAGGSATVTVKKLAALGEIGPLPLPSPYPPGSFKAWVVLDSSAVKVAPNQWQYTYTLKNTGNTTIGPNVDPASDNHADFYVNEHPSHAGLHHETFNQPDNGIATEVGFDSRGDTPTIGAFEARPPGIGADNYYWEGLGDGGAWAPGQVITLGFLDPHGPGRVAWNGRVHGSGESVPTEAFEDPGELLLVPVPPVGGTTELLVGGFDAPASASDGSGGSFAYAAVAAAGALALAAGGWYARRRWLR